MSTASAFLRQSAAALRVLLLLTVAVGVIYPLAVWGVGQVAFNNKANGSLVEVDGEVVGSRLLGQAFDGDEWFLPRPSIAGDGYDPLASGASNAGPNNPDLLATVQERKTAVADREGVPESEVPADAVTASGSGLDPDISPEYADLQVARVAEARGLSVEAVQEVVDDTEKGRGLGILGAPSVNVLELNLAVSELEGE